MQDRCCLVHREQSGCSRPHFRLAFAHPEQDFCLPCELIVRDRSGGMFDGEVQMKSKVDVCCEEAARLPPFEARVVVSQQRWGASSMLDSFKFAPLQ